MNKVAFLKRAIEAHRAALKPTGVTRIQALTR